MSIGKDQPPAFAPAWPASRAQALARLEQFVPRAGRAYAEGRNHDPGPARPGAVSRLSPWLRYRMISEAEVVAGVLARHGWQASERFWQEVLWRTYWKGWLEQRPAVWARFLAEAERQRDALADTRLLADAEAGNTGIAGFDDWARELVATGYLHNHARMWFASIWIFTLRLPWALGAQFFLRHLIDADAASNTLSWRWVAGLHTPGKTYLATPDNIARHTGGRFAPVGLATQAPALSEAPLEPARPLPPAAAPDPATPALLLVTQEDLHPEPLLARSPAAAAALVVHDPALLWGAAARDFVAAAADDTARRLAAHEAYPVAQANRLDAEALAAAALGAGLRHILTPWAPVGPVASALARLAPALQAQGITLAPVRRGWDSQLWPHATKGFFPFKARLPALLPALLAP